MEKIILSVPSKTFLVGEYAVLNGGGCFLLATKKRFKLTAQRNENKIINLHGIDLQSPAGKFVADQSDFFKNYQLSFADPYQNLGGFGASSAQFILVYALKALITEQTITAQQLLADYVEAAYDGQGISPSGVDVVAQWQGNICYYHKQKNKLQIFNWPFSNLDFCLIHTGNKLATHLHLRSLKLGNTHSLEKIVERVYNSVEQNDAELFIDCIQTYGELLHHKELVSTYTQRLLTLLQENPKILAAKGCGAFGADVILLLFNRQDHLSVIEWLNQKKLQIINYGHDTEQGLQIEFNDPTEKRIKKHDN